MIDKLFLSVIKRIYATLRAEKRRDYSRDLPFADYFVDRWERAKSIGFGEETSIYDSCLVLGDVSVGQKCWIGPFTILDGSGGLLSIGNNCVVSAGVHIYTHDTVDKVIYGDCIQKDPVIIGDNVYIGPNSIIARGVKIGNNVIIGANSYVNKDISSNSKGYGTPFRVVESISIGEKRNEH